MIPITLILMIFGFLQADVLVEFQRIDPDDIEMSGFQLDSPQKIKIEAKGVHQEDRSRTLILGTAWILESQSRKLVWSFPPEDYHKGRLKIQKVETELDLQPGVYEVYYSSYPTFRSSRFWNDEDWGRDGFIGNFFEWLFGDHRRDSRFGYDRDLYDGFGLKVTGQGKSLPKQDIEERLRNQKNDALISLVADQDELYLYQGFKLNQEATIRLYALGEAHRDAEYDFGWIQNLDNRQRVWQMDYRNTENAGGADKNREISENITLDPGQYVVAYVTDDSHSPREWNACPPYDPVYWGITLYNVDKNVPIDLFDYSPLDKQKQIVSLTPMRDDQFSSEGFTLKRPAKIQVYAIGEGMDREMYDYGWLVDADTHEKVWAMDYRQTVHAGGAAKNRLYDGIIELAAGSYIAYYATDGSHAYNDWNDSPPYDPDHWGLTLSLADEKVTLSDVSAYRQEEDPAILSRIIRVRDREKTTESFTLTHEGKIRIYALGEGARGRMYDYAWIENAATGKVVWEMSYRMTEHAGGARKNRVYNDVIPLEAGKYYVVYESDDSHSYNDWNDSPPHDPMNYGITIYQVNQSASK